MKFAILLAVFLAIIQVSLCEYPVAKARSSLDRQNAAAATAYYPAQHTIVKDDDDLFQDDYNDDPYRRDTTYSRATSAGGAASTTRRRRPETRSMDYTRTNDQQRWAIWPRSHEPEYTTTVRSTWRRPTTPVPTRLPPRLLLKSGDNVHFGEGIQWSVYKTDEGLTRIGTRDGEVVVRVVRPDDRQWRAPATEPPTTTQAPPPTTTPYQWQWQPCYNEQDCYRQYVNEYYRFYSYNQ